MNQPITAVLSCAGQQRSSAESFVPTFLTQTVFYKEHLGRVDGHTVLPPVAGESSEDFYSHALAVVVVLFKHLMGA